MNLIGISIMQFIQFEVDTVRAVLTDNLLLRGVQGINSGLCTCKAVPYC